MLKDIAFLADEVEIVAAHQEHYDERGYPRGLRGEQIPLGARIFAVVDTLDAMTSDRPYRRARTYKVARAELIAHCGTQFDHAVIDAFLTIAPECWEGLRAAYDGSQTRTSAG